MKKKMTILLMTLLSLSVTVRAQWAVFDPSNFERMIQELPEQFTRRIQ